MNRYIKQELAKGRGLASARREGQKTGASWDKDWTPGGPFMQPFTPGDDQDWKDFCAFTVRRNKAYLTGFRRGLAERKASDAS